MGGSAQRGLQGPATLGYIQLRRLLVCSLGIQASQEAESTLLGLAQTVLAAVTLADMRLLLGFVLSRYLCHRVYYRLL